MPSKDANHATTSDSTPARESRAMMTHTVSSVSCSPPVDVVRIADRTHMGIWHKLGEAGDPTSERIIAFVSSEAARLK